MKYPKRSEYKYAKARYRVRNWAEYEAGLQKRGDVIVWLSDDALDSWRAPPSGKPGGQRTVDLPISDHTTLSRRLKSLRVSGFRFRLPTDRPLHLLIDSTGLRIHVGHMQKPLRNRAWRKLHIAVDADTGQIVASDLTARRTHDCTQVPALLEQIDDPIASVSADGAYDTKAVHEAAQAKGEGRAVRVIIPPGRDAQLSPMPSVALRERNRNIRSIRELGRREWHRSSGYTKRSMVENTVFRYKTIIGRSMRSRTFDGQRVEVQLACKILNTMTHLGIPDSYRVA